MEYVQMTLNDWVQMKQKLKQELLGVKQSFVRIGYALRKIEEQRLYEQDGYKSIVEFAKAEYGLEPSTTSRFMSINREYSIDGYSEILRPEFTDLGRSQLEEMLKLPDSDRQMIQPEASREDIRNLKRFNKTEPAAGVADDIHQLVEKFYKDNPDILNEVFSEPPMFEEQTIKHFTEIVNPGGNRSYKKGLFFLMMYENRVVVKKFGNTPQNLTWWKFYQITVDIFGDVAAGPKTWQRYFGGEDDEGVENELMGDGETHGADDSEIDPDEDIPGNDAKPADRDGRGGENGKGDCQELVARENVEQAGAENQGEKNAPAQKNMEILEQEDNLDDEDKDTTTGESTEQEYEQETEAAAGEETEETESGTEIVDYMNMPEKAYGTRKGYMDTLTAQDMAIYISEEYKGRRLMVSSLAFPSELEKWLLQEVDERGKEVLEA